MKYYHKRTTSEQTRPAVTESHVSDTIPWRKYRIRIHSEPIRTIPIHSDICIEPVRIIPYESEKIGVTRLMKKGQKSI